MAVETCITICYWHSTSFVAVTHICHNLLQAFNRLCGSQNMYHNLLWAFNRLCGSQHMYHNLLQAFTGFAVVKTGLLNIYKPSTISAVVKTGLSNFYKPSAGLLVLQNWLAELLQCFNRYFGCQSGLTTAPQTFNWSKLTYLTSISLQQALCSTKRA